MYDAVCSPAARTKAVFVLRQDVIELSGRDVDAQITQSFEQQRLRNVAVVILVEAVADEEGAKVVARQDIGGQRGQQRVAIRGQDAFAPVAGDLGLDDQFLDKKILV